MQVSKNGIDYFLVNGGTEIIDSLPAKVFEVKFSKLMGTWLSERKELSVGNFKIYGDTPKRVEKIFRTFGLRDRNLGVLLSGEKGMGKSVFMRYMSEQSVKRGLPVIVINNDTPGIADFIAKIDQECVILFDEFEKNFMKGNSCDDDDDAVPCDSQSCCNGGGQNQFLPIFDGMDNGKKLFVIAVNNSHRLSSFFINRPGRFYYHFYFSSLSEDEVREYVMDTIKGDKSVVEKLVLIARFHDISYDILSAIVTELNNGYSLRETIDDLNIDVDESSQYYDFEVIVDGISLTGSKWVNKNRDSDYVELSTAGSRYNNLTVFFDSDGMEYDAELGCISIPRDSINSVRLDHPFGDYGNDDDHEKSSDVLSKNITKLILRPHNFGTSNGLDYLL